jgi:hypothetical protein
MPMSSAARPGAEHGGDTVTVATTVGTPDSFDLVRVYSPHRATACLRRPRDPKQTVCGQPAELMLGTGSEADRGIAYERPQCGHCVSRWGGSDW